MSSTTGKFIRLYEDLTEEVNRRAGASSSHSFEIERAASRDDADRKHQVLPKPVIPANADKRRDRLGTLVQFGLLPERVAALPSEKQDQTIIQAEAVRDLEGTSLFGNLPEQPAPDKASALSPRRVTKRYRLRREELGIPAALVREELPPVYEIEDELIPVIASHFCGDGKDMFALLNRTKGEVEPSLKELFLGEVSGQRKVDVRLSNARIAEQAQREFEYNDSIDTRKLRRAPVDELNRLADAEGYDAGEADLRRVADLTVMKDPGRIHEAIRFAQTRFMNRIVPVDKFRINMLELDG